MSSIYVVILIGFFTALALSFILTPLCIILAKQYSLVDNPDGRLKTQKIAIPYGGGIAIFFSWLIALCIMYAWCDIPMNAQYFYFMMGTAFLFIVGLLDDLYVMQPSVKFFMQVISVLLFFVGGFYLKEDFFLGNIWRIPGSLMWMLTIINAYNLVDIMDGLAATIAISTMVIFIGVAYCLHDFSGTIFLGILIGAIAGFLYYNFPPEASIYLGDAGALFVGGVVAVIPFFFTWGEYQKEFGYIAPAAILMIPITETCSLIVIRLYKGLSPFRGSRDHFAHYLAKKEYSKKEILFFVLINQILLGVVSLLFVLNIISCGVLLGLLLCWLCCWISIIYKKNFRSF